MPNELKFKPGEKALNTYKTSPERIIIIAEITPEQRAAIEEVRRHKITGRVFLVMIDDIFCGVECLHEQYIRARE